ncbi:PepSY domain-containing protein [Pseudoalteromonas sp. MMG010]|uniref:PepSY-associated TM helix domain-containing protein n=1 Tax=Pseudoalteromonas sp. MMG010 TaxID=2822685 RepID=UPI001B39FB78|nr:PepSY-associated TM helix domain-containing protein [Pseudoalteromonas sp. MMG010]MBQ4833597.1 PepSY domain-containing protein [Pseudoalteromonas sp. MMG010]
MKDKFLKTMTWVHLWVGLLACWIVYIVFYTGTVSFFRDEINLWNQPAIHNIQAQEQRIAAQKDQLINTISYLSQHAENAPNWRITLPEPRIPYLEFGYAKAKEPGQRRSQYINTQLDPNTMQPLAPFRETKGGAFFYQVHYQLYFLKAIPGRWVVCIASFFMLIAIVTGIIIHKRIFKDMFNFKKNKGSRAWFDAHTLSSVLALPFHLMITYTGIMTLIFMLFPYPAQSTYDNGVRDFYNDTTPKNTLTNNAKGTAPLVDITHILDQVYTKWPNADIRQVLISKPAMAASTVTVLVSSDKALRDQIPRIIFSGASGELIAKSQDELSNSKALYEALNSMHTGRFADPLLRWLFVLGGVAGCIMIASSCMLWAKRIREKNKNTPPSFGLKLVEGLNLTTIMGLPFATCGFFIANRLLDPMLAGRADKEIDAFFAAWLVIAILALLKRDTTQWRITAYLNAIACLAVPIVNAFTTEGNIISYALNKQWALFIFDALFLLSSLIFIIQSKKLRTVKSPANTAKNKRHEVSND